MAYFWLSCWMQEKFHFAKIVTAGHKRALEIFANRIDVGAIRIFRPNSNRVKRQATILRRPFDVARLRR